MCYNYIWYTCHFKWILSYRWCVHNDNLFLSILAAFPIPFWLSMPYLYDVCNVKLQLYKKGLAWSRRELSETPCVPWSCLRLPAYHVSLSTMPRFVYYISKHKLEKYLHLGICNVKLQLYAKGLAWSRREHLKKHFILPISWIARVLNPYFNRYLSNVENPFADNSKADQTTFTTESVIFFETFIWPFVWTILH